MMEFTLGLPVLSLVTRVHHAARVSPTAFERVLLRAAKQFGPDPVYGGLTLDEMFADILCVPDPAPLVQPTLERLVARDLVRTPAPTYAEIALRDLALTERGETMFRDDMLPAEPKVDIVEHCYDALAQTLLRNPDEAVEDAPEIALDAGRFADLFPQQAILDDLASGRHRWLALGSQVERLERQAAQLRWRRVPARLIIEAGTLRVQCDDEACSEYLAQLPGRELYEQIVAKLLPGVACAALPRVDAASLDEWHPWRVPDAGARVWLVDRRQDLVTLPAQAAPGQVIVVFTGAAGDAAPRIEWNAAEDGAIAVIDAPFPISACFATERSAWSGVRTTLRLGQETLEVPLLRPMAMPPAVLDGVADHLLRCDEAASRLAGLMLPPETYWPRIADRLLRTGGDPFRGLAEAMRRTPGVPAAARDAAIARIVAHDPPADLAGFERHLAALRELGWQAPFPSDLYSPAVLAAAANVFATDALPRIFSSSNGFDSALRLLDQRFADLAQAVQAPAFGDLQVKADVRPKTRQVDELSRRIDDWLALLDQMAAALPRCGRLGEAAARVAALRDWRDRLLPAIDARFRQCFVIDTNVLIERPAVLSQLAEDEFLVVPKLVLEELDRKKLDPTLSPSVRQATTGLERLPASQRHFAEEDLSLVPPDYLTERASADTRILSVALRYRRCRPVVLTNDRLLSQKAIGEGLQVMTLAAFERRNQRRPK